MGELTQVIEDAAAAHKAEAEAAKDAADVKKKAIADSLREQEKANAKLKALAEEAAEAVARPFIDAAQNTPPEVGDILFALSTAAQHDSRAAEWRHPGRSRPPPAVRGDRATAI